MLQSNSVASIDRTRLRELFDQADRRGSLGARIDSISRALLGRPYVAHPLIGDVDTPEVFTASLDGFDCVTYVETALALALAGSPAHFAPLLQQIRYDGGAIDWQKRNHYTSDWIRRNSRAGFVQRVDLRSASIVRLRTLNVLPGYPVRRIRLRCTPKRNFWAAREKVQTGDVLMFASTKANLDIFHLGFAVREGDSLRLRHASRSRGRVVEQELAEFLGVNHMAGVIVVRPVEPARAGR